MSISPITRFVFICAVAASSCLSDAASITSQTGSLTIDQLLQIKHPSSPLWSPDGRFVAFVWDEGGIGNLYVVNAESAGQSPRRLTSLKDGQIAGAFWSKQGGTLFYPHQGTLWQVSLDGGEAHPLWTPDVHGSSFVLSPDGSQIAYVRGGGSNGAELCVRAVEGGADKKIARDSVGIAGLVWSPDGQHIVYNAGSKSIIHNQTPAYSGAKIIYTITERTNGHLEVASLSGGPAVEIDAPAGFGGLRWVDNSHVVLDRQSSDFKKHTAYVADIADGKPHPVHEDVDEKFWSIPGEAGSASQPSPNGKWIMFVSDRDGWDHVYVMSASGGTAIKLTEGDFEAWRPEWSHDSSRIAFDANSPDHPGDRQLWIATITGDPSHPKLTCLTSGKGTNTAAHWSPDDHSLVYQHTDPQNSADLFAISAKGDARPVRLTNSMPAGIDHSALVEPEFVHFPGADGQMVPGWLFVPKNLDRSKKHPAVVWIHGDGINQNYDGWHVQRNYAVYYSFHQYLLQQGYVVFAPDYRGSIGYGRAWRQGVYMDVGGKDAKDAWMSANYLKTLPFVDANRIGVWGLSYGGFFTLIAVTDQPTLFRAAVDVAGVVDYAMYYEDPYHGGWTASRIGTPEEHPDIYKNASPISHIDRLQRPLLILHGTADVNVPYLQSVRLIDEALKNHKGDLIRFMMYPGEFHYFDREHVLRDAWTRVDEFFNENLTPRQ
ncbi:MAG TPA: prolyl oligopeptidase family serine peptidase [Bryobacteraceae bacterium]|nr:prolyl oligopeptidase family serine peptidase [Bryobacteraceae bacterium]